MGDLERRLRALEGKYEGICGGAGVPYPLTPNPLQTAHDPERLAAYAERLRAYAEELERRGWSIEDQADRLLLTHIIRGDAEQPYPATDRELFILDLMLQTGTLSEDDRPHFTRMRAAEQPKREAELFARHDAPAPNGTETWDEHARRVAEAHYGPRVGEEHAGAK